VQQQEQQQHYQTRGNKIEDTVMKTMEGLDCFRYQINRVGNNYGPSNKPTIHVNTALKAVLDNLYSIEMNQ
jgi:hypothetical protein